MSSQSTSPHETTFPSRTSSREFLDHGPLPPQLSQQHTHIHVDPPLPINIPYNENHNITVQTTIEVDNIANSQIPTIPPSDIPSSDPPAYERDLNLQPMTADQSSRYDRGPLP
jgi:hypothetical protein